MTAPDRTEQDKFLSTPSARRATHVGRSHSRVNQNFYPRPPRGGRQRVRWLEEQAAEISIHALREEGDEKSRKSNLTKKISIHALREEGDRRR